MQGHQSPVFTTKKKYIFPAATEQSVVRWNPARVRNALQKEAAMQLMRLVFDHFLSKKRAVARMREPIQNKLDIPVRVAKLMYLLCHDVFPLSLYALSWGVHKLLLELARSL